MLEEVWKDAVGFEGRYQVSNYGRVKSLGFYNAKRKCFRKGVILKQGINSKGYLRVNIKNCNSLRKNCQVHRLVAQAFIPNPNNMPEVNHINGIKSDNRVENLEWVSAKQNTQHALKNGLRKSYYRPVCKIKNGIVIEEYESIMEASKKNNVKRSGISRVLAGRRKTTGGYEWRYKGGRQLRTIIL